MRLFFTKMHGLGNDYIYMDGRSHLSASESILAVLLRCWTYIEIRKEATIVRDLILSLMNVLICGIGHSSVRRTDNALETDSISLTAASESLSPYNARMIMMAM